MEENKINLKPIVLAEVKKEPLAEKSEEISYAAIDTATDSMVYDKLNRYKLEIKVNKSDDNPFNKNETAPVNLVVDWDNVDNQPGLVGKGSILDPEIGKGFTPGITRENSFLVSQSGTNADWINIFTIDGGNAGTTTWGEIQD